MTDTFSDDLLPRLVCSDPAFERTVLEELAQLASTGELLSLIGTTAEDEKRETANVDMLSDPTQEELRFLGPDYVRRIVDKTLAKIHHEHQEAGPSIARQEDQIFQDGLTLLELLKEVEVVNLVEDQSPLNQSRLKVAEGLADLWTQRRERVQSS